MGFLFYLEVMFFLSFFWGFFHFSLVPAVELGGVWPPDGIDSPFKTGLGSFI
jgi:cytochrome c oxidase subunit 3